MLADPLSLSGILKESRALATQKRRGSTPRRLPPHPPLGWVRARRTRTPKKRLRAEFSADIEPGEFPLNRSVSFWKLHLPPASRCVKSDNTDRIPLLLGSIDGLIHERGRKENLVEGKRDGEGERLLDFEWRGAWIGEI
ncbi:hypothetical protein GWI33_021936 [Rhynchophorus ferrugineus]|uniref:Uncharacterized protein n=1 Tax=Rhynchophorus ferrugineus TaxID=354439 RepID=A0A834HS80_RHYFE|nr:hypothetical protein GWI33_021936 [Rhynchophorus ferrugineus]